MAKDEEVEWRRMRRLNQVRRVRSTKLEITPSALIEYTFTG